MGAETAEKGGAGGVEAVLSGRVGRRFGAHPGSNLARGLGIRHSNPQVEGEILPPFARLRIG
jgi:hypothetical protein